MQTTKAPNLSALQIYLVGGAVRDLLLGISPQEKDWVVIGASVEQMLSLGFKPVGKDFPVFLHPITHEEYALARTERKTAPGYKGFIFHASPDVTLIEDLQRRDLTINAIAQATDGTLIDPYGGQQDLQHKILRHVSPAFSEDPVRILRVARFMARFGHLGFKIAEETRLLMHQMVLNGEVHALVAERVWQEFDRALSETTPLAFFEALQACGALTALFPSYARHFPVLEFGQNLAKKLRFARLNVSLSTEELQTLGQSYPVPRDYMLLAKRAQQLSAAFKNSSWTPQAVLELLNQLDVWRQPEYLTALAKIFPHEKIMEILLSAYQQAKSVTAAPFLAQGLQGIALGEAIQQARLHAITRI